MSHDPRTRRHVAGRVVPPPAPRALALALVVLGVLAAVWWSGQPPRSVPGSPPRDAVEALLDAVEVVESRNPAPGYERDCSGASGCVFGPAWSDTTGAPGAGNGCSTRHDVLARDLVGGTRTPGARCEVSGGVLTDPYTGRLVDAGTTGVRGIHVDHVYPLSAAWDLGAWSWPAGRRAAFANDIDRNLLAVTASVNTGKSDSTPADWLPPDPGRHCFYASRYLTAAVAYGLPVTRADHDALAGAVRRCPTGP
ncbi:HNH endonuclease family protein [Dietzia kunjamensis]|uniref:HNH endonuclease family protein n=1 Tax=Dietzia kunjamensis TaxID=322509 RepID=UPI001ABFB159|nr:HNH endonuclease family protein [Dietzia kunjamensis]